LVLLALMVLVAVEVVQANQAEVPPVEYYEHPEPTAQSVERLEGSDAHFDAPTPGRTLK
jgi:hypothetical protein